MFVAIEIIEVHSWRTHPQIIFFTPPSSNKFAVKSAWEMGLKFFHVALWHQSLTVFFFNTQNC